MYAKVQSCNQILCTSNYISRVCKVICKCINFALLHNARYSRNPFRIMYFFEVLLIIPLIIRGSEPSAPAQISLQTCRNEGIRGQIISVIFSGFDGVSRYERQYAANHSIPKQRTLLANFTGKFLST